MGHLALNTLALPQSTSISFSFKYYLPFYDNKTEDIIYLLLTPQFWKKVGISYLSPPPPPALFVFFSLPSPFRRVSFFLISHALYSQNQSVKFTSLIQTRHNRTAILINSKFYLFNVNLPLVHFSELESMSFYEL